MQTLTIERMTYGVDALAHLDGKVVFVPYAAPQDEVEVEIVSTKTDYLRASLKNVVTPSPIRQMPACPNFPTCGGCHWLQIDPETQRSEKEAYLRFILRNLKPKVIYPLEPLTPTRYRNKMELKAAVKDDGTVVLGNYKFHSHEVVPLKDCIVQCPENMKMYDALDEFFNKPENAQMAGNLTQIIIRTLGEQQHALLQMKNEPTEEMLDKTRMLFDGNQSLSRLELLAGNVNHLTLVREKSLFNFMKWNWIVSPRSFFQNNLEGAEAILFTLQTIYSQSSHKGKFLDLFCGCGLQSLLLENRFEEAWGIECNEDSYQDAVKNQRLRSASRMRFLCRKVETIFGTPITKGVIAALHLNPPRTGLSQRTLRGLAGIKPKMITYLSCNPMTFGRDAQAIIQMGYSFEKVYCFDLFPGTFHVEVLGLFTR